MKKILLLLILLFPLWVSAKDYTYTFTPSVEDNGPVLLTTGDRIVFNAVYYAPLYLYVDNQKVDGCFGTLDSCNLEYSVTKDIFIGYANLEFVGSNIITDVIYHLYVFSAPISSIKTYYFEDVGPYKAGDFIMFSDDSRDPDNFTFGYYVYDYNDELVRSEYLNHGDYNVYQLPFLGREDTVWRVDVFEDGRYGGLKPHFYPVPYVGPNFSLNCDSDRIEYGKKTSCTIYGKSKYALKDVSFNLSNPNFKITNAKPTKNMGSVEGEKEYNLVFPSEYDYLHDYPLMTFDVEATKPENYTDRVQILDIYYTDIIKDDEYGDLDGAISVIYKMINPETFNNLFFIIIPLFLSGTAYIYYWKEKNKIEEQ